MKDRTKLIIFALLALLLMLIAMRLDSCHASPSPAFRTDIISAAPEPGTYGVVGVVVLAVLIIKRRK